MSLNHFSKIWVSIVLMCQSLAVFGQYQLNGVATQLSCNCYELTPNTANVGGSVWNTNQIDLSDPFDFTFDVWLGCDEWGADGIAFVLQPVNVNQGGYASSLGYGGIVPSVAVEIDTWPNDVTMSDPPEDHIAIMQNGINDHGSVNNLAGPVVASSTQNDIEDCAWHTFRVVWTPSVNALTIYFDGAFRTSYTGDIVNNIFGGSSNVYWGWTGGTGGASAEQRFCNTIEPDFTLPGTTDICAGDQVTFEDASITSSGNISNFSWDFGDGTTGSGSPVTHTFQNGGTFDVELTITTEGCSESEIIPITVDPIPNVDLGTDVSICDGESVQLNSPNSLGSGSYSWSPTTGLSNPTAPSPTANVTSNTTYSLTYTSNNGCSASDDILVTVNPLPVADAGQDQSICENELAQLSATGGQSYDWSPITALSDPSIPNPEASPASTTTYSVTVTDANNCTDIDDVTITVEPSPTVDAGLDEEICEGDLVQLNAVGTGDFSWSPSTALSSTTIANPEANPTSTTTYFVTLTDANNCSAVDSLVVDVDPIPVAAFDEPDPTCIGNAIQFDDNSTGDISTYSWDFGDGQFGQGATVSHLYSALGTYTVTLSVVSGNGCSSTATGEAQIVNGPVTDFTISNGPDLCLGETLEIIDNSSGPIATYDWDFGDGTTSTIASPNHAFTAEGAYTVTLTLTAVDQCSTTQSVDVLVNPIPNAQYSADLSCSGAETNFTDASTISQGVITNWDWSFGDGATATDQNPTNTYSSAGNYASRLVVTTAAGCSDTATNSIAVHPTPALILEPEASCTDYTISIPVSGDTAIVESWNWDFGDGNVGVGANASNIYSSHGDYPITLSAVSDSGCATVAQTTFEVFPSPTADFSVSENLGCAPLEVTFTNESTIEPGYQIAGYEWFFGDAATSFEENPSHTYTSSDDFDISLIAATATGGCVDTMNVEDLITVYLTPQASFTYSPVNATMIDPNIEFTNTSVNGVDYVWDFGDGGTSNLANPENFYDLDGDYMVTLEAINGICSSSNTQRITIKPVTFVYIPNAFTPNGDGRNDVFVPKGIGIEDFNMTIFDRWGKRLYYTENLEEPFRGWYNGLELPIDTYVYRIEILDVEGEWRTYRGNVNLVR
jgi:gliding motility-associated-like protein